MTKLLAVVFFFCTSPSWGQIFEIWVHGGQNLLSSRGLGSLSPTGNKDDVQLRDGFRIAAGMAFNSDTIFGHEIHYAYNRTQLRFDRDPATDQGMAYHQFAYNYLVYATREGTRIRPFATGGVHFNNYVPPGSSAGRGGGDTKFGVNYGAGVKVRLNYLFALRFDVRQYTNPKPFDLPVREGWLRQTAVSAGFGWAF
jgi:hypothetical protein